MRTNITKYGLLLLALSLLTACLTGITIGGSVTGLTGTGLVLRYRAIGKSCDANGCYDAVLLNETLNVNGNGNFTFKNAAPSGATSYFLTIDTEPSGQACTVMKGGYGAIPSASVNDVSIQCGPSLVFNLLAGSSTGSADGTGAAAMFGGLFGITLDSAGNLYVSDSANSTIRKITPEGVVTTLAGTAGSSGSADGTGADARFGLLLTGIAADSAGNVYVTDSTNYTIRKITPVGVVTTLAGVAGSAGSADGTGPDARFSYPSGIAVDSAGNLYVCDGANNTIRKITPEGVVTTLAGAAGSSGSADGTGADAKFNNPMGITADSADNLYVADTLNHTIRKVSPAGVVTTLAGTAGSPGSVAGNDGGTGAAARFDSPIFITIDSVGTIYVSDEGSIRKISPAGVVTTIALQPSGIPLGIVASADKLFVTNIVQVLWATIP